MRRPLIFIIYLLIPLYVYAQELPIVRKSFPVISLENFIEEIEQNNTISFFFLDEWIDKVEIRNIKENTSVFDILDSQLRDHGLDYFFEDNRIYIYPGARITSRLPQYNKESSQEGKVSGPGTIKSGEEGYIQTREILTAPEIVIGSKQNLDIRKLCIVKGNIINQRENEALIGATIYINELELGLISDVNGKFEMRIPPGEYTVDVHHMAMKTLHFFLQVYSDGEFPIELQDEIIEIEEVTISDTRYSNVKSMQMGQDRISVKTMREIPVVMGEKDIIKIAQMLPGVQNVGEGSSGINVRGGTPDQNMFYINKVPVYNTSHLFGFFTAFNPDVINDFTLYKNNIPSKYGGRIASVFDISTRPGHKDKYYAHGGFSPVTGHFSVEGPVVKDKVSFVGGFRSTYSDWLLKQLDDYELNNSSASFYDGTLEFNADINENNELRLFLYRSSDKFSLSSTNEYDYSNSGASLTWDHSFRPTHSMNISLASSNYAFSTIDNTNISEAYIQNFNINHNEFRADFLMLDFDNHRIEYGAGSVLYSLNRGNILPFGSESTRAPVFLGKELAMENAIYVSDEIKLSSRFNLLAGLRFSYYSFLGPQEVYQYLEGNPKERKNITGVTNYSNGEIVRNYSGLEPRLAMNFLINNESSIKASYNRIKQYLFLLSNTIAISPNDQWKLTDYHIKPPLADQVSIGYYRDFKDEGINFSFELYNKWVSNVVDYKNGANFVSDIPVEQQVVQGKQGAYGAEFLVKKTAKRLTGWLSYTYSRSNITMNSALPGESINRGDPYASNFDRPHSINFAANLRQNKRLSISTNVVYYTGRPITLPVGIYYSEGEELLLYSNRNQYRVPDYFRIDLSLNLEGNLKNSKIGHSYWMLNVYNLTGRKNAYSVFYKIEEGKINGYKLSVFPRPIITISWQFKLGNYTND